MQATATGFVRCACLTRARKHPRIITQATANQPVYEGKFGRWSVEKEDVTEVVSYRAGINIAAACAVAESTTFLLPDSPVGSALRSSVLLQDAFALGGAAALGVSLVLIHVYVAPLKRAVQAMWAAGTAGGVYLMATHADTGVVDFVGSHPWAVWFVGPLFAAVTGVGVKEGLCYGKFECAAIAFLTPVLLLSHLGGFLPESVEKFGVGGFAALCVVFALRKWTQRIEDDIGDKSVFQFLALSEGEQVRWL